MFILSEKLSVLLQCKHIAVRINTGLIQLVQGDKLVAHFVAGIAEHQHYLLSAHSNSAQTDCKPVSGQNRENNADGLPAQLRSHILRNGFHRSVIPLRPCHHRLCHCDHVPVTDPESFCLCRFQDTVCNDLNKIISFSDDRAAYTP